MRQVCTSVAIVLAQTVALAAANEVCPSGEKRLRAGEECIPAQLFNYLYCLQNSGGGKVEVQRKTSNAEDKSLEVQIGGKGSGVIIKGEGSAAVKRADVAKAANEIQEKLNPTLANKCQDFANALSQPAQRPRISKPSVETPANAKTAIAERKQPEPPKDPTPPAWSSFGYRTIGSGWAGEFRRDASGWREFNKDHPSGRRWTDSSTATTKRIRLTDGTAVIEIDAVERKIYYTDPASPSYPVPTPIYQIFTAQ